MDLSDTETSKEETSSISDDVVAADNSQPNLSGFVSTDEVSSGSVEVEFPKNNDTAATSSRSDIGETLLFQTIVVDHPLRTVQNLQSQLLFCIGLIAFVIWATRREQRIRENKQVDAADAAVAGGGGGTGKLRSESNMSGSLLAMGDDNISTRSPSHRRRRSKSHEFFLTPLFAKFRAEKVFRSEMRSELYHSLHWAGEEEEGFREVHFRRSQILDEPPAFSAQTSHAQFPLSPEEQQQQQQQQQHHRPSVPAEPVIHHGANAASMIYHTWTPPPSWTEAARRVFPRDVNTLRRVLRLNVLHKPPTLTVSDAGVRKPTTKPDAAQQDDNEEDKKKTDFCLSVTEFSVHPTPPTEGVLEIYVKNSPKSTWMEHTFQSAQAAAQFQTDLLAVQVLGPAIQNMYNVFRLIHQGSVAHDAQEFVLHDRQSEPSKDHQSAVGIAWDDVMRCFGSVFPKIRIQLEDLWWNETKPKTKGASANATSANSQPQQQQTTQQPAESDNPDSATAAEGDASAECSPEYANKRLLLGPVDFFRLFVPIVPNDALPYTSSDVKRMDQMLRWRKRVARASLLLQAYARARELVNHGWNLGFSSMPDGYVKFRLAYDMNIDNQARDKVSRNEYYEPYVSRDVFCRVRGINFKHRQWYSPLRQSGESVMSLGQAFSLIRGHLFHLPTDTVDSCLNVDADPVLSIPSLRELVEGNPEVEFFVIGIHNFSLSVANVYVYARNMPKGVDSSFDTAFDRFKAGNEEYRKRKLEFLFQLGLTTYRFPLLQAIFLKFFAFLIWILDVRGFVAQAGSTPADRVSLPAIRAEHYGHCRHFGGALATNPKDPKNYTAVNCRVDPKRWTSMAGRLMIAFLSSNSMAHQIMDVIVKIRGDEEDELPERVLCVKRLVRMCFYDCALPAHIARTTGENNNFQITLERMQEFPSTLKAIFKTLFVDSWSAAFHSFLDLLDGKKDTVERPAAASLMSSWARQFTSKPSIVASSDPFEKAVNVLIEILEDVRIPIRGEPRTHTRRDRGLGGPPSAGKALEARNDIHQVSILRAVNRSDLRRYFVASDCSLKKATVRIVESAAWRGLTFPIDIASCRVELQTGQFFQQGRDKQGRPVFYFRNMCRGPWRGDEDAVIAATLHRLETSLVEFAKEDPDVKCTVIILLGKPKSKAEQETDSAEAGSIDDHGSTVDQASTIDQASTLDQGSTIGNESAAQSGDEMDADGAEDGAETGDDDDNEAKPQSVRDKSDNPRVPASERVFSHTNDRLVRRLVQLLMLHYPERLYRALVVKGHGGGNSPQTVLGNMISLSSLVNSANTRRKVKIFRGRSELQRYVDKEELIQLAGGQATVSPSAFDVK